MRTHARRAAILLETVIAVTMLAIAVPATVSWMQSAAGDRADATNALRASIMASSIAEQVIADSVSSSFGMNALLDPQTYLDLPTLGLRARLAENLSIYTDAGFNYQVAIGDLVGPEGVATGDPRLDVSRILTITVFYPSSRGAPYELTLDVMVTDP